MRNLPTPLLLHLGCGKRHIPGFYHVDLQDLPHIDHVGCVENLEWLDTDTAELIYASHVLEHFGRTEFRNVLGEWHRVLKPGGILRLAVPDFAACARLYYERGLEDGLSGLIGLICGGQRDAYDYHKMIFDEDFLTRALLDVGFADVRRWDWRTTSHADIDDYSQAYLPHLAKDNGMLMSLNLEAVK
ncbi:MAG: methyltransferase domain-containing protein [Alphaproteobacteria bacterium]|jgi:predicted SAM-dependent methyltransferase|nr:methyltransferase domain-containing protein [Alphaproteobacteria bacterium]